MSAIPVDLADARAMDPAKVSDREGRWYLRQVYDDGYHVALLSERAPAGTSGHDLKPGALEIVCDHEEGLELDPVLLAAFLAWPPAGAAS